MRGTTLNKVLNNGPFCWYCFRNEKLSQLHFVNSLKDFLMKIMLVKKIDEDMLLLKI